MILRPLWSRGLGGERDEAEAESGGLVVEVPLLYIAGAVLLVGEAGFISRR